MNKFMALLLALAMVLSMAACGGSSAPAATEAPKADAPAATEAAAAPVEISLWTFPVGKWGEEATVNSWIEAFQAEYPHITVKVEYLDYQAGDDKLNTAIEGGQAPDLIFEGPERLIAQYAARGLLLDLTDLLIDGPFVEAQKDLTLRFRGSRNQRILDMNATRQQKRPVLAEEYL